MTWKIKGKTEKGQGMGSKLGYPTLNIAYEGEEHAVYAGKVLLDGQWHWAAINLGRRPTIGDDLVLCEAYLLDWSCEIAEGTEVEVEIIKEVSKAIKCNSLEELKEKIARDVEMVRAFANS